MFKNKLTIPLMILIILAWLMGCNPIYNLSNFVIPNDEEFLNVINELDTPKKACQYMKLNFIYQASPWNSYNPYQMWLANVKTKVGDCNDYSCFAVFVANYHGYEIYQILISYYNENTHMLGVFVEGKYTYSDVWVYHPIQVDTFEEIVNHHCNHTDRELKSYRVYDYNMKIVKE